LSASLVETSVMGLTMDLIPFKIIFEHYIGKWSEVEDFRYFRSFFGIHPEVACVIMKRYGSEYLNRYLIY